MSRCIDTGRFDGDVLVCQADPRSEKVDVYVPGFVPQAYCLDADVITGKPGAITSARFTGAGAVLCGDSWGYRGSCERELASHMDAVRDDLISAGLSSAPTAGAMVGRIVKDLAPYPALRPRWRGLAHMAIHAGPMTHLQGGCERGAYLDLRRAYMHAMMTTKVPVGTWYLDDSGELGGDYIAEVDVYVKDDLFPALPVRLTDGRTVFPTGLIHGAYPSNMLEYAVGSGRVEVTKVRRVIRNTRWLRAFEPVARMIDGLGPTIKKPLYTRVWGKCAVSGMWLFDAREFEGSFRSGELWCRREETRINHDNAPAYYHPDWSAFIVAAVHNQVRDAVMATGEENLIATHVDAIWTSNVEAARRIASSKPGYGEWKLEDVGRIRYYAQGRYFVDGAALHMGHNGLHREARDIADMECLNGDIGTSPMVARLWDGSPRRDKDAVSYPVEVQDGSEQAISSFIPEDRSVWNASGFLTDEAKRWESKTCTKKYVGETPKGTSGAPLPGYE